MSNRRDREIQLGKYKNWLASITYSVLFVLHDKEGFGNKRLSRFLRNWEVLWDDVQGNWLKIQDIKKALEEECGITLKER